MAITGVTLRVRSADLERDIAFYEGLTGETVRRFAFGGAQLASVGPFLLVQAAGALGDRLAGVRGTIAVYDLEAYLARLGELGAQTVAAAAPTPNGRRAVVRHPDGAVFEYVSR